MTEAPSANIVRGTLSYQPHPQQLFQPQQQLQQHRRQGVMAPTHERQEPVNEQAEPLQHVRAEGNSAGVLIETETFLEASRATNTPAQVSQPRADAGSEPPALLRVQGEPREEARAKATIRTALEMGMLPMQQTQVARNNDNDDNDIEDVSELLDGRATESITTLQVPTTSFVSSTDSANPSHNSIRMRLRQAHALRQPLHPQSIVPRTQSPQTLDGFGAPIPNPQTSREATDSGTSAMPTIHVTIGRVEVRATAQPSATRKPSEAKPGPSLDEYLRARNSPAQGGS